MSTLDKIADKLPRKTDDHFPYASSDHAYWSGYFTSKPEHKRMIRELSNLLQVRLILIIISHLFRLPKQCAFSAT
jgi:hypothetical protein